jgi:hypothetical protein
LELLIKEYGTPSGPGVESRTEFKTFLSSNIEKGESSGSSEFKQYSKSVSSLLGTYCVASVSIKLPAHSGDGGWGRDDDFLEPLYLRIFLHKKQAGVDGEIDKQKDFQPSCFFE